MAQSSGLWEAVYVQDTGFSIPQSQDETRVSSVLRDCKECRTPSSPSTPQNSGGSPIGSELALLWLDCTPPVFDQKLCPGRALEAGLGPSLLAARGSAALQEAPRHWGRCHSLQSTDADTQ